MQRAYSLFEVKSANDDKRELTGTASTPEIDRVGDIVEPKGAVYSLPIPFLWQHDAKQPVGHVTRARIDKNGIDVTVQIAKTDEPGVLKDRLDEAWQSIKLGLVRGLSIGFQPIEKSYLDDGSGVRYQRWSWLELSAVTIAANASASIANIKRIDTALLVASGHKHGGVTLLKAASPGVSGTPARASRRAVQLIPR